MKRRIMTVLAALVIVVSLISCDEVVDFMGKMGGNIAGADTKQVETAVESVKVTEDNKTKTTTIDENTADVDKKVGGTVVASGNKFTFSDETNESKELYSVGKTSTEVTVIGIGDKSVSLVSKNSSSTGDEIKISTETIEALSKVETVLPPQDLTSVKSSLDGAETETLEALSKPVEDETTKKAAEGTQTVVTALLEVAQAKMEEDSSPNEKMQKTKELVDTVLNNLKTEEGEEKKDLTLGDVVVLQAITNVISQSGSSLVDLVTGSDSSSSGTGTASPEGGEDSESGEESKSSVSTIISEAYDEVWDMAEVMSCVSSSTTMFEGVDLSSLLSILSTKE